MKIYKVGGAVRDELLGLKPKDYDFAVEAESFEAMKNSLLDQGFTIFLSTPEYFTIRARFPKGYDMYGINTNGRCTTADFVLCRKESSYSDGRRPDSVEPGTIYDDLARRDFTVNAIAQKETGVLVDPFNGVDDLNHNVLKAVGSAEERLREDALRALRALRFSVTRNFVLDDELGASLKSDWLPPLLMNISEERQREELYKMFKHNTLCALGVLFEYPQIVEACFWDKIWLRPTMEQ